MKDETGKTRKETKVKSLPCILTEEERLERSGALASVVHSIANHEKDLTAKQEDFNLKKKEINGKISKAKSRLSDLADVISDGSEKRDVDCESLFDYEEGTVIVRRLDTGEVIEDREMEALEKQMQLEWEEENAQEGEVSIDPKAVVCESCDGAGQLPPDGDTCDTCKGEGVPIVACDECDGSGLVDKVNCGACQGKGYVKACDTVVINSEETETPETDGDESD